MLRRILQQYRWRRADQSCHCRFYRYRRCCLCFGSCCCPGRGHRTLLLQLFPLPLLLPPPLLPDDARRHQAPLRRRRLRRRLSNGLQALLD